ncbi:MAG: nucleoside-triphosphatase [Bacteroidota bacterium]
MNKNELNDKWIKASITGTLWAASEIVLGSFLHNLKVPFSGNVLTAIGIIILISVSYIWTEKGLFWRAGIICAIMKTMSPSAVIFGPMIAIFSEAVLLEISVRLLGKTVAGYILGAMLAMSWNLFQKIANFIIYYGFNIVDLYANLIKFAQKQLNIHLDIVWLPPIVLLILYCILGFISALIGIRIGRKILKQPAGYNPVNITNSFVEKQSEVKSVLNYSMIWLFADIVLIIGSLVLLNYTSWIFWSSSIIAIVALWALRYKKALRQLSKPKFWIFFVLITMVTAFVFTKVMSDSNSLEQGLLLGLQMNFRAVIIIVGFSVLGTELYNPRIREFFLKTSFKQLPLALELSFESLPAMIANIPEFKTILKNPVSVFYQVISLMDFRLTETKRKIEFNQKVFILTGSYEQGKTTLTQKIIEVFKENKISVGGIYSPRIMENNKTIGYDIIDIVTNEREIFLRQTEDETLTKIGRFSIFPQGLLKGYNTLKPSANVNNRIVIIDEAGYLELENRGWASSIQDLLNSSNNHILLVVRDIFVEKIIQKWNLIKVFVFNISEKDHLAISKLIIEHIR